MILPLSFYRQDTLDAARKLLGCFLVHSNARRQTIGRIVETEAYKLTDPASHGYKGRTERNSALFGPVGHAYVYFTYGNHFCFNVTTGRGASKGGVLVRALEPIEGIALMRKRRDTEKLTDLCSGPGKLTRALGITLDLNGFPLDDGPLQIWSRDSLPSQPKIKRSDIFQTTRIGLTRATELPWRFYLKDNPHVSRR